MSAAQWTVLAFVVTPATAVLLIMVLHLLIDGSLPRWMGGPK